MYRGFDPVCRFSNQYLGLVYASDGEICTGKTAKEITWTLDLSGGETVTVTYGKTAKNDDRKPLSAICDPTTGEVLMCTATYEGINAKEMGDLFTTTLYGVDTSGKTYYNPSEATSMREYLLKKLYAPDATQVQKTMVVDMLRYGAAAQTYFDYNVDALVTDSLSEEQLAYATQELPEASDASALIGECANVSANITLRSKVERICLASRRM